MDIYTNILSNTIDPTFTTVMFIIVYAITLVYVLSFLNNNKNVKSIEDKEGVGEEEEEEDEDGEEEEDGEEDGEEEEEVEENEYEDDSDDSDSIKIEEEKPIITKEIHHYPKMRKLFLKMSRKQLIRIAGKSFNNDSKRELVNIALHKFQKYTIEKSFDNFGYLPKYVKNYAIKHFDDYIEELNTLFSYSNDVIKEKLN